jgi:hypothetical protein
MMVRRRDFLKQTATAGMLLAGYTMMGGCSGVTRQDVADCSPASPNGPRIDPTVRRILYHASLAPSGHNSQPWRVRIETPDTWIIAADADRRLPCVDPDNRELLLSLGAFTENLRLAAGTMGKRARIRVITGDRHARDIVRMTFTDAAPTDFALQRIRLRRTVKHGFSANELSAATVASLTRLTGGGLFYIPRGTAHAACIRDAAAEAFRIQAGRDDAQRELVRWLRLTDRDARRHRDGLTTEGMEIQGIKGWYVRHVVAPEDFLTERFRRQGAAMTSRLAQEGGGWLVITSPTDSVADLIDTGRRFQRMALAARDHGIGIHPMTQVLEEKTGRAVIADNHDGRIYPQFVLRVGHLDRYPAPVSLRRPVEWFVAT